MTRCRVCDRKWSGLAECHCAACHKHFKSITAFDKHQIPAKRCLTEKEMLKRGMVTVETKNGLMWITKQADFVFPARISGHKTSQGKG